MKKVEMRSYMQTRQVKILQSGFGLVEVLVAMLIGLFTMLAVMQTMSLFEGRKRATSGGSDAQTNAVVAVSDIERYVKMAGFGLPMYGAGYRPFDCNPEPTIATDHDNDGTTPNIMVGLFPILLTDGGGANVPGNSDQINIRLAIPPTGQNAQTMSAAPAQITSAVNPSVPVLSTNVGCKFGDTVLHMKPVGGFACGLSRITAVPPAGGNTITLNPALNNPALTDGVSCIEGWTERIYTVLNNNLMVNGLINTAEVVSIQAQYGLSASVATAQISNVIDRWVEPTGAWAVPSVAERRRIKAVRVAVVARNSAMEINNVTQPCVQGAPMTGLCAWADLPVGGVITVASPAPVINLTNDPNWQQYRYRVFEITIPIRNLVMSRSTQ